MTLNAPPAPAAAVVATVAEEAAVEAAAVEATAEAAMEEAAEAAVEAAVEAAMAMERACGGPEASTTCSTPVASAEGAGSVATRQAWPSR